jgi:hypothetical protein
MEEDTNVSSNHSALNFVVKRPGNLNDFLGNFIAFIFEVKQPYAFRQTFPATHQQQFSTSTIEQLNKN